MTDKTPAEIADTAAEAIRSLNYATPGDLVYPGDAYSTVGNLSVMAMRLPQALQQIAQFLKRLEEAGQLKSDTDTLGDDLEATYAGLTVAAGAAETLRTALDRAQQGLGTIAYKE
ncbi:hypothetical protein [Streptomyces sp. NPDC001250]|uniref:hypothetical protein n=1 Tax=Streptomyces TaxID=1883 RepID=UPI003329BAEE